MRLSVPGPPRRLLWGALVVLLLACGLPTRARANDFDQFEAARNAYDMQDYAKAAQLFENLVGGDVPRLTNRSLLLESEKYLGASYLFLGKLDLAEQRFDLLLHMDPGYLLDPLGFPEEVQRLFARVKTRLDAERSAADQARQREQERLQKAQQDRERREHERWQKLTQLAQTEHVNELRSRWLAAVPFGVGQFQNGHQGLGLVLAVSEISVLALCITSYGLHESLRGQKPAPSRIGDARLAEEAFRYTNQISFGLFAALAVTGIIDAQLRFQSSRSYDRRRPLPPSLYGGPELSVGPTGMALRLRF